MPLMFHLEGFDRCGKSTVSDMFTTVMYKQFGHVVTQTHSKAPPKQLMMNLTPSELEVFSNKQIDEQFDILNMSMNTVVLDRSWVGENVYGKKYRGRLNSYVFKPVNRMKNIYILFFDAPINVLNRDDGKSTFKCIDDLNDELRLFKLALTEQTNYIIFADASLKNEQDFHNTIVNMMVSYYVEYTKYGYVPYTIFQKVANDNGFITSSLLSN